MVELAAHEDGQRLQPEFQERSRYARRNRPRTIREAPEILKQSRQTWTPASDCTSNATLGRKRHRDSDACVLHSPWRELLRGGVFQGKTRGFLSRAARRLGRSPASRVEGNPAIVEATSLGSDFRRRTIAFRL